MGPCFSSCFTKDDQPTVVAVRALQELRSTALEARKRLTPIRSEIGPSLWQKISHIWNEIDLFIENSGAYFPYDISTGETDDGYSTVFSREAARLMGLHGKAMTMIEHQILRKDIVP